MLSALVALRRSLLHRGAVGSSVRRGMASFLTIPAPGGVTLGGAAAAPELSWTFGGVCSEGDALDVLARTSATGWVNVVPNASEKDFPRTVLSERGVAVASVGVAVPHGLTLDLAARVVAAVDALPPGPLVVQCATGNRASAVLAVLAAARGGLGVAETFAWASAVKLPFLGTQPLRNWVAAAVRSRSDAPSPLVFRQLFHRDSSTYTYLLGSDGEALLIDPVLECAERDAALARELGLRVTNVVNTHVHADHVSSASRLRALLPGGVRSLAGANSGACVDACLAEGQRIAFGRRALRVIATPGHTEGCISLALDDDSAVFTGDALLIRGCGRTDFQGGSSRTLHASVTDKLFSLPRACVVWPGHDYNGASASSIGEEMDMNPRLGAGRSGAEFEAIMAALALAKPALIDVAVPANLRDGIVLTPEGAVPDGVLSGAACFVCRQDGGPTPVPDAAEKEDALEEVPQ